MIGFCGLVGYVHATMMNRTLIINRLRNTTILYHSHMLKTALRDKLVAVVGYQALSAKVLIKKILPHLDHPMLVFMANKHMSKVDKFITNSYFTV